MTGRLRDLTVNRDGTQNITVTVSADFSEAYDELKSSEVTVEIKRYRKHRSQDANALAWVLIDQIAERMKLPPREVYRTAIRELSGVSSIVGVNDGFLKAYIRAWEAKGIGWQAEVLPTTAKEGWSNVRVYLGSSEYDTAQMSQLIHNLIQDAEALGIPTLTEAETEQILGKWATKKEKERATK